MASNQLRLWFSAFAHLIMHTLRACVLKGTALDEALAVSLKAFEGSGSESKAIILITDGEDHSGRVLKVAEQAAEEGVRIFPIGIGRDEGSPIPAPGGGFRRDRRGVDDAVDTGPCITIETGRMPGNAIIK